MSSTTTTTTTSLNTTSSSSSSLSSSSKMASRTGTKSITKSSSKNVVVNNNGTSNTVTNGNSKTAAATSGTTKNAIQQSVVVVVAGNAITAADVTSVPSNSHPTTVNDYSENTCIVCFKEVDIFSIGDCNHAVCYECSTRMRVLCCQNECPICRQDLAKVIFTKIKKNFRQLELDHRNNGLYDKKYRICFEDIKIRSEFYKLLEYRCRSCNVDCFLSFRELEDHLRSQHERFYCDFCTENLKIFSFERKLYTYKELGIHKTIGDADNKSHRGHPLCEFCHIRYFDRDELFRHMRREHFFCHFCDADGVCNQFYPDYISLRGHYTMEHFLCEEGECADEQFTAVFRSDIDLKAHKAQVHGKGLGKTASKQARTLEFEFTLPPRNRQGGGGGGGGGGGSGGGDGSSRNGQNRDRTGGRSNDQQQHQHHHHRDDESEMGSNNNNNNNNGNNNSNNNNNNLNGIYQNQSVYQIDTQNTEQFPSLGSASGGGTTTTLTLRPNVSIHTKSYGTSGLARTKENFPALGGQNINDQSLLSNERQSNAANTLFKQSSMAAVSNSNSNSNSNNSKRNQMANGNSMGITTNKNNNNNKTTTTTSKQQKPGMIIHVSNRPTTATSATTSSSSSSSNSNEFPSLPMSNAAKKKAQLYEDLGMMGSMSMGNSTAISTKHRSLMDHFDYSSCLTTTTTNSNTNNYNKISFVQQSDHIQQSKKIDTIKKNDNVPKINSKDIFPTLGKISGTGTNHSTNTINNNNNNNLSNSQQTTTTPPQWVTQKKSTHQQQQQHPISKLKQNPQQVSADKTRQNNEMVLKISNNSVANVDDLSDDYRNNNHNKNNSKNIKNNNNNVIKINNNNKMDNNKLKPKQQKGNHNNNNNKKIELESGYIDNTTDYNAIEEYISVKHRPLTKGGFIHESTRVNSKLKLISQLPTTTTTTTTGAASAVTSTKSKTRTKSNENDDEGVEQQNDYENVPLSNKKPILPISIKSDKNFPKLNSKSTMKDINNNNNNNNNSTSSSNNNKLGHLNSIYSELLKSNLNSEKLPNNNGKNSIDSSTSNSIGSRSRSHSSQSSNGSQDEDQSDYTDFMNGKQTNKKLGGSKGAIPKNSQSHNSNNFINSVTLNSIAKPINNLTFTTSTGEQFSILPQAHQYMAPEDAMQRNLDLVTKVQNILETPVAVEEFKNISQLFRDDGYHAYPYYEHCEIVLGTEFDRIFPELLSLLPDIGKQQELYLVYSQQLKIYNKEAKSKKKKQRISIMEVCSVCKQVLINKDYPPHMQAHIFLSEFPATLG